MALWKEIGFYLQGQKQPLSATFSVTLKERPLCFRKDPYGSCPGTAMDPFPQIKSQHTFRPQHCYTCSFTTDHFHLLCLMINAPLIKKILTIWNYFPKHQHKGKINTCLNSNKLGCQNMTTTASKGKRGLQHMKMGFVLFLITRKYMPPSLKIEFYN